MFPFRFAAEFREYPLPLEKGSERRARRRGGRTSKRTVSGQRDAHWWRANRSDNGATNLSSRQKSVGRVVAASIIAGRIHPGTEIS